MMEINSLVACADDNDDTPVNPRVANATVQSDLIPEWNDGAKAFIARYGDNFRSRDDCEYFYMLPLSKEQRVAVVARARSLDADKIKE
jgi:hypothetical protein